jgi:hypothetical protein
MQPQICTHPTFFLRIIMQEEWVYLTRLALERWVIGIALSITTVKRFTVVRRQGCI